jgi:hypothetical protein
MLPEDPTFPFGTLAVSAVSSFILLQGKMIVSYQDGSGLPIA